MNKIYNSNLEYLKELNEALYYKIINTNDENVFATESKKGYKNIIKKIDNRTIHIHSQYDYKEQVKYLSKIIRKDNPNIIFIFGMGFGYEVKELIKRFNDKRFFIIEPDTQIFKTVLQNTEIKNLLNYNNNMYFIQDDNNEKIIEFFEKLINEDENMNVEFLMLPSYMAMYKESINDLHKKLNKMLINFKVNFKTNLYSKRQWVQNYIANFQYLNETCPVTALSNIFKDIPAIIVGAGPSVEYDLEKLKEIGNRAIIVPVGTGLNVIERNNIKGHIMGAIDGAKTETDLFENLNINKNINLFYSQMVHYKTPELNEGNKFLINNTMMDMFTCENLGWKNLGAFSGPSIANSMLYNLCHLGCNPIILLGEDLCFTDMKSHASGSKGFKKYNQDQVKQLDNGFMKTQDKNNKEVYTTKPFFLAKNNFEFCINLFPHIKYLNGTKDGLKIEGTEDIDFNDYADKYLNKVYNVQDKIESVYNEYINNFSKEKIYKFIKNIEEDNNLIIEKCKKIIMIIENNRIANKEKNIKLKITELDNINFYKNVVKQFTEDVKYIYKNKEYYERIKQTYAYILDKCLIMKNSFDYEVNIKNGGE